MEQTLISEPVVEAVTTEAVAAPVVQAESNTLLSDAVNGEVKIEDNQVDKKDSKEADKPLEYADFTMPEGMILDQEISKEFKEHAKELNLSQEQAQKIVNLQAKHVSEMQSRIQNDFKVQVEAWKTETLTELGPSFKEDQKHIANVVKQFGSAEFTTLLNQTGLGNNKEVVKFLINVGKGFSSDRFIDGKQSGSQSAASILYPSKK